MESFNKKAKKISKIKHKRWVGRSFPSYKKLFSGRAKVNLDIFRSIMQNENNLAMDLLTKTYTEHTYIYFLTKTRVLIFSKILNSNNNEC